jgi:NAD(P)-dependent dehydrogenase (short-subunit alcohol dehydrogenase family)
MQLAGKTAIVTGATSGLGADIARRLHSEGASVVIAGIEDEAGAQLVNELGARALYVHTDILRDDDIERCLTATIDAFGRLDTLVNNACIYVDRGLESTRDEWLQTLNVNLVSGAIFVQKALPYLTKPSGTIINIGSTGGKFGAAGRALYPASKAAILQVTRNEAVTLAPHGIRVLSVSPAWTWSPAVAALAGTQANGDAVAARFHPLGRLGRGDDIGRVIAFLCSDGAAFMTGVDVPVDGGFSSLGPDQGRSPRQWFADLGFADFGFADLAAKDAGETEP